MADISEAAIERAHSLLKAVGGVPRSFETYSRESVPTIALARYIQQASDAAKVARANGIYQIATDALAPFILPEPADPLVEVMKSLRGTGWWNTSPEQITKQLREYLSIHGLRIVEAD